MSSDITITLPEFAIATAAGIGWAWAWTTSGMFRPVRQILDRWFPEDIQEHQSIAGWIAYGSHCAPCAGFWLQFLLIIEAGGWSLWALPVALTAVFVHLVWLQLVLTLTAIQLR